MSWLIAGAILSGCSGLAGHAGHSRPTLGDTLLADVAPASYGSDLDPIVVGGISGDGREAVIEAGTPSAGTGASIAPDPALAGRSVQLNFVDTDVREFARILFSEQLKVPYAIDPAMTGYVTIRSGGTIDGNRAIALARQALEASGNTIGVSDGVYRVMPLAAAGYDTSNTRTFQLDFIEAAAAKDVLAGFLEGRAQIIATTRSSMTVRGDTESLSLVASILASMDIDRFSSASFGLFPLKYGNAESVSRELASLYAGVGAMGQSILPLTRINSVLVIAPKSNTWSSRRSGSTGSTRASRTSVAYSSTRSKTAMPMNWPIS